MDTTAARAAAVARHRRPLLDHVPAPRRRPEGAGAESERLAAVDAAAGGRHGHDVTGLLDGAPVRLGAIVATAAAHLVATQASSST
ncbi:hypothetical protein GXB85_08735 [Cellulomonas sp. APG4]|uniref:hypothetical protein n=1 Tax=Cellulomonas sp. APG4 TaxID=1538656 RepID=UPI00137964CE|nr:hypothetical protein [Cellulomonas sp. APG4]NCT91031.1 hypothetical protein [Cellulomonas sp. APG4]